MRGTWLPRGILPAVLSGCVGLVGCTHNHYYTQGTPVRVIPGEAVHLGELCEPGEVITEGSTIISRSPSIGSNRVVVSEPVGSRPLLASRGRWTRVGGDPAGTQTVVQGALDTTTTR